MNIINNIKIKENISNDEAFEIARKKLNIAKKDVVKYYVYKKSLDARNKDNIYWHYSFVVELRRKYSLPIYNNDSEIILKNNFSSKKRPIIVGSGPSGLFAALTFVKYGISPIILEMGKNAQDRKKDIDLMCSSHILNEKSNIQFGEGGAGTFSDGKLTTSKNSIYINQVLKEFVKFGAPSEILYLSKPHIGTDNLFLIVQNIRKYIISKGGTYYFNEELLDFNKQGNNINVITNNNTFETNHLILATGHSSFNIYKLLKEKNVQMKLKNFAIGARIEHLADDINFAQYGKNFKNYPTSSYKLTYQDSQTNRSIYSFCMCPGGYVMPSQSDFNTIVTNGMSNFKRDNINSNSALIVNISPNDFDSNDILSGINFINKIENKAFVLGGNNYNAPITYLKDLGLSNKNYTRKINPTYPGVKKININDLFSPYIVKSLTNAISYFDTKIDGFANENAVLTMPETRTSSTITILRNKNTYSSSIDNVYPIGEGAGNSGGIMTSAIDGIKVASSIIEQKVI